jgi:alpha-glucosidase
LQRLYEKKQRKFFCLSIFFLASAQVIAADTTFVKSPNGQICFQLFQKDHQLYFNIRYQNQYIIHTSPLIMTVDEELVTKNISINKIDRYKINESYPWLGVHSKAVNNCNAAIIFMRSAGGALLTNLEIKIFNDGAAFRFDILSEQPEVIPDEGTIFNLPPGSFLWYHDMEMHYEGIHVKKRIGEINEGEWVAPPATFKLPQGVYASVTEAAVENYPGMTLQANGKNGLMIRLPQHVPTNYPYRLRYSPEDTARLKKPAGINGHVITPWRVILIGDLNTLVNSDIINDLNPPPDPKLFPNGINTEWIRPGRAVWKYLNGGGDGTLEVMKHFTDAAAALGFEHNILEGFWTKWTNAQLKELVDYSKQKGVGIWLWKHSKSLRNPASRDSFFRKCNELGITGAKIDFFDHEAKEVIDLYSVIFKDAAKYHVLLDFHGANKPTGLARTYPNSLTYEAVKGMEASKLMDRATHETTLPFTRLLAGPAEYTVVHFGERRKNTTWAHQIASAAILSAPLLTYAANPDTILANPAVEIIKSIPATWDETIVLPGSEIGELVLYARRKGDMWFVAVMNGVEPKRIKIPLKFLKGNYKALIAKDDPAFAGSVIMENKNYSDKDAIELDLVSGGGFIARFLK